MNLFVYTGSRGKAKENKLIEVIKTTKLTEVETKRS